MKEAIADHLNKITGFIALAGLGAYVSPYLLHQQQLRDYIASIKTGAIYSELMIDGKPFTVNAQTDMQDLIGALELAKRQRNPIELRGIATSTKQVFCKTTLPAESLLSYTIALKTSSDIQPSFDLDAVAGMCNLPRETLRAALANAEVNVAALAPATSVAIPTASQGKLTPKETPQPTTGVLR